MTEPLTYFVEVSREMLPELREWSEPLHVRIASVEGDVLRMEFRRPDTSQRVVPQELPAARTPDQTP